MLLDSNRLEFFLFLRIILACFDGRIEYVDRFLDALLMICVVSSSLIPSLRIVGDPGFFCAAHFGIEQQLLIALDAFH